MPELSETPWKTPWLLRLTVGAHAAAAATLAMAPSTWPWVGSALLANHATICGAVMTPRSRLLGPNLSRLTPDPHPRVALTFDDGPDPDVTPVVLDLLDDYGACATFFCIGRRAEEYPGIVSEIIARGHHVENHTYRHPKSFAFFGPRAQEAEVERAQDVLAELSGRRPRWFRAPAGFRNIWLGRILHDRGLRLASWTRRGYDTVEREPARVARRLLTGLGPEDVLLLHDGSAARDRNGRPVVLEALPRLLDEVTARDWQTAFLPSRS